MKWSIYAHVDPNNSIWILDVFHRWTKRRGFHYQFYSPNSQKAHFQIDFHITFLILTGDQYYRFTGQENSFYPQPLSQFRGLPSDGVDAAFQYSNSITYFFKGSDYYRFNDRAVEVQSGYPLNTAIQWLGCDPNELLFGDATVMVPSMVAVLFSALSAIYYAF